jgi:hypothetical protein
MRTSRDVELGTEDGVRTDDERADPVRAERAEAEHAERAEAERAAKAEAEREAAGRQSAAEEARFDRAAGLESPPEARFERSSAGDARTPLFPAEHAAELRREWEAIQTGFVDEPRRSVEAADALVVQVTRRLTEAFASERGGLEEQWSRGDSVSTEDLRVALRRYRSFFDRLLSL